MKDIYEHLNHLNLDDEVFEEMEVSEFEKTKVKRALKRRITKSKQKKWKKTLMAAAIAVSLTSTALVGLSFSAYAEEIPFLGNVFKYFNKDGVYDNYEENANELNVTEESNGIKITVNNAIFDGKSVVVTYTIESDKDLGESAWITGIPMYEGGAGGYHEITKIEENKYIGMTTVTHPNDIELSEVNVDWVLEGIMPNGYSEDAEVIEGEWKFHFDLVAVDSKTQLVDQSVEGNGIIASIEKVTFTPMSFLIYFEQMVSRDIVTQWDYVRVDIEVKDNLGNVYINQDNGGYGSYSSYDLSWSKTFGKLDPEATQLIVTPVVELSDNETLGYGENGRRIKANYRLENSKADIEKFELNEIIIGIEK
ncbi:DUF4179 domain-containing protein [Paenisporosarcina indica]|uniref:DUF4179 domain-containing protein n=1 Tax=Paenisporosarcina indica TaxID=650093 RepID=UPI00094FBE37|nr:DUF4179 domain-containing protein [Paenisporosarcina indica]